MGIFRGFPMTLNYQGESLSCIFIDDEIIEEPVSEWTKTPLWTRRVIRLQSVEPDLAKFIPVSLPESPQS